MKAHRPRQRLLSDTTRGWLEAVAAAICVTALIALVVGKEPLP